MTVARSCCCGRYVDDFSLSLSCCCCCWAATRRRLIKTQTAQHAMRASRSLLLSREVSGNSSGRGLALSQASCLSSSLVRSAALWPSGNADIPKHVLFFLSSSSRHLSSHDAFAVVAKLVSFLPVPRERGGKIESLTWYLQSAAFLARFRQPEKVFETFSDEKETILRSQTDTFTLPLGVVYKKVLELAKYVVFKDELAAENDVVWKILNDMEIADECRHLGIRRPPHF